MARWYPDAVGRLQEAAMDLYGDPGYDNVTVAEIAARAGLTRRTFFRYFSDKREVLFFGTSNLEALATQGVMAAPDGLPALEAVAGALAPVAQLSDDDPAHAAFARRRHSLIQANAELRERELSKHASLANALVAALQSRGVTEPAGRLAAVAGLAAFTVGFERWNDDPARRKLGAHVRDAMRSLTAVVCGSVVLKQVASRGRPSPAASSRKATRAKGRSR